MDWIAAAPQLTMNQTVTVGLSRTAGAAVPSPLTIEYVLAHRSRCPLRNRLAGRCDFNVITGNAP
jgi:hypothetical protein